MKTLFLSIVLLFTIATATNAGTNSVDSRIVNRFKADFGEAVNASWTVTSTHHQVTFDIDGKKLSALYTLDGDLIGTSSAIAIENLPVKAKRAFAKKFDGYTVREAQKFELQDETSYYIYAVKDNEALIIKLGAAGEVAVMKKTK